MAEYSEQNLKYAAELRNEIHREALAIVRRTLPDAEDVVDRHPVEDYFQEVWDYPGKWYPVVAIPYGYKNRKAFVDSIVENTLAGLEPDPFYLMIGEYPDLAVDYFIVKNGKGCTGYEAHMRALKTAFGRISDEWEGDPDKAVGTLVDASRLFSSDSQKGKLNYRNAFLDPPHGNSYNGRDFERVNEALFPSGTDGLEVYEWSTDWSEYFDDGHEWWGTLCLTVYDKTMNRFAVIMASATD